MCHQQYMVLTTAHLNRARRITLLPSLPRCPAEHAASLQAALAATQLSGLGADERAALEAEAAAARAERGQQEHKVATLAAELSAALNECKALNGQVGQRGCSDLGICGEVYGGLRVVGCCRTDR